MEVSEFDRFWKELFEVCIILVVLGNGHWSCYAAEVCMFTRVFHFFTIFEIKNVWGLIWWGFGHNEKIQNYLLIMTTY